MLVGELSLFCNVLGCVLFVLTTCIDCVSCIGEREKLRTSGLYNHNVTLRKANECCQGDVDLQSASNNDGPMGCKEETGY